MNIIEQILTNTAFHSTRPVFVENETVTTYADLKTSVTEQAEQIRKAAPESTRMAMSLGNTVSDITTALAVILAGHSLVALPPGAPQGERNDHLHCCKARVLLDKNENFRITVRPLPDPSDTIADESTRDIAFIRPTSGTTGTSKGVMLSHECIAARIDSANSVFRLTPDDTVIWTLGASYHFASSILLYLSSGARIVPTPATGPAAVLPLAVRHRATMLYGSPWQFRVLAADRSEHSLPHLRWAVSAGQHLPTATAQAFADRFGHPLRQTYGIIEAGLVTVNGDAEPAPPDSVGPPAPGFEIHIVDDAGRPVRDGLTGEVLIKGKGLFSGYITPLRPVRTLLRNGFFPSGDQGVLENRVLTLKGRTDFRINTAGHKVFPEEVEEVIEGHPAISEARVYGVEDRRIGKRIVADIVFEPGQNLTHDEIFRHCSKRLSPFKIPFKFNLKERIAYTPTGKKLRCS